VQQRYQNTLNRNGYTLLELLIYIVIVSALLMTITTFFSLVAEARVKNQSISEVNDQGAAIMDYITQTIRNATSITAPATGSNAASLTLVVPTGSLSPTIFDASGSPSNIRVKEGAGAAIPLSANNIDVSGLNFRNLTRAGTNGIVQVQFTVSRVNPLNRNEYDYRKTFISSAEVGK